MKEGPTFSLTSTGSVMSRKTCEAMFVKLNSRYHRYLVRPSWLLRSVLVLAVALTAGLAAVTRPSVALAAGQPITAPFPHVGVLWPDVNSYSDSAIARHDYVVLAAWTAPHLPAIKAKNPNIIALLGQSACELDFYPARASTDPDNVPFAKASARWLLTQAGSTLTANVNASTTSFPVAATSASGKTLFAAGDFVVIDEEIVKVTAVGSTTITVTRGQVHPAASHSAGARIAAAIQFWPDSLVFDVTAACPRATVDSAIGPETWNEWNARQAVATVADPAWSGLFLDRSEANQSWLVTSGYARTIDPNRSNTVVTDYSAFNTSWNSGLVVLETRLRSLMGDRIVMGNGAYPNYDKLNGSLFELFPNNAGGWLTYSWHDTVIGPGFNKGSYLTDWMTKCPQPALSTIWTKECELTPNQAAGLEAFDNPFLKPGFTPNYRKMRFGLTTALLGDGFFAYGPGTTQTNGHGFLWFDEYDNAGAGRGYLGSPLGEMSPVFPALTTPDLVQGQGGFDDQSAFSAWTLELRTDYSASCELDGGTAKVQVAQSSGSQNGVLLSRHDVAIVAGATYTISFRARADRPLKVRALVQRASSPYSTYMTSKDTSLTTNWRTYEIPLTSAGTDPESELMFTLGESVGSIWLDDVKLQAGDRNVYRRDFEGGIALVNATSAAVTANLNGTFRKIRGEQVRAVNDGSLVTAVTLQPNDGLVLLRPSPADALRSPVYRFFNKKNGSHFYTADVSEQVRVLATLSATYSYDGVAYTIDTSNAANRSPLYRFFNKKNGSHFYTASESEKNAVLASLSATYSLDGPAYNVCLRPMSGTTTIYRFFNKKNGSHFYTASESEKNAVLASLSATYSLDGPAFYVAP